MSEPKKVDRRKFIYAGVGAAIIVLAGSTLYLATKPAETVTSVSTSTVPTTVTSTSTTTSFTSSTTTKTSTPWSPVKLTWVFPGTSEPERAWAQNLTNHINTVHPGNVTVETQFIPWANIRDKITVMLLAGNPPDTAWMQFQIREFAKLGSLLPLDDYVAEWDEFKQFEDFALETHRVMGKLYAIPTELGTGHMPGARDDLVKEYWGKGFDAVKSWDDWIESARAVNGKKPGLYGFALYFGNLEWAGQHVIDTLCLAEDMDEPDLIKPEFKERWISTFKLFKSMYELSVPGAENMTLQDCFRAYAQGSAAYIPRTGAWLYGNIEPLNPTLPPDALTFRVFPPGPHANGKSYWRGESRGDCIFKACKYPDQAFEMIKAMHTKEFCARFNGIMEVPCRKDITVDDVLKYSIYSPPEKFRNWAQKTIDLLKLPRKKSYVMPSDATSKRIIGTILIEVCQNKRTPEEAADKAITDLKNLWGTDVPYS